MKTKTKTTATKEEAMPALVPKLRFPEFRGAEGWRAHSGNRLFDQIGDKNPEPGLPVLAITQEHGAIPRDMIDYHVSVTDKSIESYKVVQSGDFIISPGHLPDSLSIDDIRHGKTNRCNPTLSEHAFRLLPYRGMGSGIPRALDEWPEIDLISEVSGNQFTARVQRPTAQLDEAGEQATAPVTGQVTGQVTDPVTDPVVRLLQTLTAGPLAPSEIQQRLELKHRPTFRANYLRPALERHWIEPTLPDKPNSRLQQYRLTAQGRDLLK